MRIISLLVLILGLALAGGAAYMAVEKFNEREAEIASLREQIKPTIETVPVAVATRALQYGQTLGRDDVRAISWPKSSLPNGAFTSSETLFGEEGTEPRTVLSNIDPDEPILASKVTGFGEDAGLASRLGDGIRAYTIRVDVSTAVAGFIQPGSRVDIMWIGRDDRTSFTRVLQSGVQVIAIDQTANTDRNRPIVARTVTIAAPVERVAELALAQSTGRLELVLRGINDETDTSDIEVDQRTLIGREAPPPEQKRELCYRTERRGTEVTQIPTPCID